MTKPTEIAAGGGEDAACLKIQQLAKSEVKQDAIHDFIAHTTDGEHIALIGSRTEIFTLEMTTKTNYHTVFPYVCASCDLSDVELPLNKLMEPVDMTRLYDNCNVLEMQQLSLEPVYMSACTHELPAPKITAVNWAPKKLSNGQLLLATLNSQGMLCLLAKPVGKAQWQQVKGINVASTLSDVILPAFETAVADIANFRQFQAYMDRSWITAMCWGPPPADSEGHTLLLGTAAGCIYTLMLSADAQTVLSHRQFHSMLGRVCYMHTYEQLLLVGDTCGLVHLYQLEADDEAGLSLVKALWLRPDKIGLKQAVFTYCEEQECYYIAFSKSAHMLVWCMPRMNDGIWLDAQLYVGGINITAICASTTTSYVVATSRAQLFSVKLQHTGIKQAKLSLTMQPIEVADTAHFQVLGICSSRHRNLLTMVFYQNQEYFHNTSTKRDKAEVRVGKLQSSENALNLLGTVVPSNKPMNYYADLLVDIRLNIFNAHELQKYADHAPLEQFAYDEPATEAQLQQLQIKYHVLSAMLHLQQSCVQHTQNVECTKSELEFLYVALVLTHIRLRLQHLLTLQQLSPFQTEAARCMLVESVRLRDSMEEQLHTEHKLNATMKCFLAQMAVHFDELVSKLKEDALTLTTLVFELKQQPRCSISYMELTPSLDQCYCTLCGRKALIEQSKLLELYPPGSTLMCSYCRGAFALELLAEA